MPNQFGDGNVGPKIKSRQWSTEANAGPHASKFPSVCGTKIAIHAFHKCVLKRHYSLKLLSHVVALASVMTQNEICFLALAANKQSPTWKNMFFEASAWLHYYDVGIPHYFVHDTHTVPPNIRVVDLFQSVAVGEEPYFRIFLRNKTATHCFHHLYSYKQRLRQSQPCYDLYICWCHGHRQVK